MKKILIVDDEEGIRETISSYFGQRKFKVYKANDGSQALEVIKATRPDLIISDVIMPVMDGFSLLEKIRKHSSYSKIPVIMLTIKSGPKYLEKGISLKADFYLPKPFELRNLHSFVDLILKD